MRHKKHPRVVSLIASATEIVCALGRRDWLVGRSHECDFPADVLALPALTAPKFKVEGTSAEIDRARAGDRARRPLGLSRRGRGIEGAGARRDRHAGSLPGVRGVLERRRGGDLHVDRPTGGDPVAQAGLDGRCLRRHPPRRRRPRCARCRRGARAQHAGAHTSGECARRWPAAAAGRLHRMGRAADGRRQLDAGADRRGRRAQPVRRGRQAFGLDAVGGDRRRRPGGDCRRAVRLRS